MKEKIKLADFIRQQQDVNFLQERVVEHLIQRLHAIESLLLTVQEKLESKNESH